MSRSPGGGALSQEGILHGRVIRAPWLDTAHEGQVYLWRARWDTATGRRSVCVCDGGALPLDGSFMETACVLRFIYTTMSQSDKTRQCCSAKNALASLMQSWIRLMCSFCRKWNAVGERSPQNVFSLVWRVSWSPPLVPGKGHKPPASSMLADGKWHKIKNRSTH